MGWASQRSQKPEKKIKQRKEGCGQTKMKERHGRKSQRKSRVEPEVQKRKKEMGL
jgi:hypothetical protein